MAEQPTQGSFRETHDSIEFGAAEATPPAPEQSGARVVYERQDAFDMQSGPYGYERVGFAIGDRVFWTGCAGSGMPGSTYEADRALAETIVKRWNAAKDRG